MANVTKIEAPNHTVEQVRGIIAQAAAISEEYAPDSRVQSIVFEQACQLLGQKSVSFVAEQQGPPIDLRQIMGG